MKIEGKEYSFQDVSRVLTVPDCNVLGPNKLGTGNGEAKFYFGSKTELNAFALGKPVLECFFLKSDLMTYMQTVKSADCNTSRVSAREIVNSRYYFHNKNQKAIW